MTDIFLVTGFLGAGKTTIIQSFLNKLKQHSVCLIINEFGKMSVDDQLLKKYHYHMETIHNGSIFCACRIVDFERVLKKSLDQKPDYIIIETSGLTNPEMIHTIITHENYPDYHELYNICVIDGNHFYKLFNTLNVIEKQIAIADYIIINKWHQQTEIIDDIKKINSLADISMTETGADHLYLPFKKNNQYVKQGIIKKNITLCDFLIEVKEIPDFDRFKYFLEKIAQKSYRIKGFVKYNNQPYYISSTLTDIHITEAAQNDISKLVVLSTIHHLSTKKINTIAHNYDLKITVIEKKE